VTLAVALILCPLALLTLCFGIELIAGVRPIGRRQVGSARDAAAVIVIPAHDEELIIGATLEALRHVADNWIRILVVADNCEDGTAKIATNMGVEVVERIDHARRGKGFALDFARQHLRADPPAIVVIIDADCTAAPGSIERLVAACAMSGRPCQASYVQTPARAGPPALQLSTFAFYIKNVVRQRALQRLAGRVHLLGTGMAFPWALFEQVELATANIVEDLEIGLQLANAGYPPLAVEEAIVSSDPAAQADTLEQRRRWEGGYLASAARWVPRMVVRSLGRGDLGGLWAAIDLLIPPLALLVTLDVAALLAAALLHAFVDGALWPLLALAAALVFAGIALTIAWAAGGSRYVTLGGLARIPVYLLWKLPLYAGLARKGSPKEWVRTRRG
jgi:cellulose synthase/poly-beta-1,6-N-acetylglucosamine synthase-like glycosyltransferase